LRAPWLRALHANEVSQADPVQSLMSVMAERDQRKPKLGGPVEVDDASRGGERTGGRRGRGAAGRPR
jgi:hypothetical protein